VRIRILKTEISFNVFIFIVFAVVFFTGYFKEYTAAFISITIHELGHLAVSRYYGFKEYGIRITPAGLSLHVKDISCSGHEYIVIYAVGPLVNLFLCCMGIAAAAAFPHIKQHLSFFSLTNLFLALFNLLPAYPLDGGRVLLEILAGKVGLIAAGRITRKLSLAAAMLLVATGIYQLYITAFNFSMLLIGIYVIHLIITGRMEIAFMNIRQIILRKSRLLKKGIYPARDIVVLKRTLLGDVIINLDFDRFHFIYVLDDNLRLADIFTETEIIDAIMDSGENITFGRLIEIKSEKKQKDREECKAAWLDSHKSKLNGNIDI